MASPRLECCLRTLLRATCESVLKAVPVILLLTRGARDARRVAPSPQTLVSDMRESPATPTPLKARILRRTTTDIPGGLQIRRMAKREERAVAFSRQKKQGMCRGRGGAGGAPMYSFVAWLCNFNIDRASSPKQGKAGSACNATPDISYEYYRGGDGIRVIKS